MTASVSAVVPWTPGTTEREFFNNNLACGELQCETQQGTLVAGCGARDWRVWRLAWMSNEPYRERELICMKCHCRTYVMVPKP